MPGTFLHLLVVTQEVKVSHHAHKGTFPLCFGSAQAEMSQQELTSILWFLLQLRSEMLLFHSLIQEQTAAPVPGNALPGCVISWS